MGAGTLHEKIIAGYIGNGVKKLIESCLKDRGLPADLHFAETRQRFLENYEAGLIVRTRLYPGIAVAIERLRASGLRLAVLTNKPEKFAVLILKALRLHPFFEIIAGEDSLPFKKPHPQSFRTLVRNLDVAPENAVMVGDGPADLRIINPGSWVPRLFAAWGINSPYKMHRWDPDLICLRPSDLPGRLLETNPLPSGEGRVRG